MSPMRVAWFSPMPPVRSGVATCSAELVAALDRDHDIDVYADEPVAALSVRARSAHEFVWRHRQAPYDVTVFQLGNSSHHDFLWPYLFRYPGLTVLHDAHLHHARAAALLRQRRRDDYRAEFAASAPGVSRDAAELAVAGFDSFLYYQTPFRRLVVSTARITAVHSLALRDELREDAPGASIELVRLGHGSLVGRDDVALRRARARHRHGIAADALVFGCFGGLTPDKRLPQILAAFAAVRRHVPAAQLLLAGAEASHYDLRSDIARHRLESHVVATGYLDTEDELTDAIAASDVTINLRWPTARELSGPWLRCLAAGRASIVTDLAHTADLPALDPRSWTPTGAAGAAPVAVAIDIADEDHSLRLAMRRLAADPALRDTLGDAARAYWLAEHSAAAMLADYRRLLPAAAGAPAPAAALPAHLTGDGSAAVHGILREFGVPVPWSKI